MPQILPANETPVLNSVKRYQLMKIKAIKKWMLRGILLVTAGMVIFVLWMVITLPDPADLNTTNPQTTALIEQRRREAQKKGIQFSVRQKWVAYSTIPEMLKKIIRISEDANFFDHEGIDFEEMKESIIKNWEQGKFARGGSTITQQLAKNLYLSTQKSIFRKIKEYLIARRLEKSLSKDRIFHLYLNVIEFGHGIFGVDAAAQYYFRKPVADLNLEEMIRLTAIIPRPTSIRADGNSRWLMWRCCWIVEKLILYHYIDDTAYQTLKNQFCRDSR
jgi:monofunctional biosynthetic peptidoglycan transglycosylase